LIIQSLLMCDESRSTFLRLLHMAAEVPVFIRVGAMWALRNLRGRLVGKLLALQPVRFEFVPPKFLVAAFADPS
jgi:hypothetical protein